MANSDSIVYKIASNIALPFYTFIIKTSIEGQHFLPTQGPAIVVSNHISYFDGLALGYLARRRKRQIHFLAKRELFNIPILGSILKAAKQIPVERKSVQARDALHLAKASLEHGHCVGIFPEATMPESSDMVQLPIRSGAIRLAQDTGVPIVVVGTWGAHEIWRKGKRPRFKVRHPHTIVVSKPYTISSQDNLDEARADLEQRMKQATANAITKRGLS